MTRFINGVIVDVRKKEPQVRKGKATPQAIYKWIHGTSMPTIDNLVILAAIFDVTMDDIVVVDTPARKCG